MARTIYTRKRPLPSDASPERIVRAYQTYAHCRGDSLGQFLSEYWRHWDRAQPHGVTDLDGITRLVPLLSEEWRDWAERVAGEYVQYDDAIGNARGDLSSFIARIRLQYSVDRAPPSISEDPLTVEPLRDSRPREDGLGPTYPSRGSLGMLPPPMPTLGHGWWNDSEAGPSRPPARTAPPFPMSPIEQTSTPGESSDPGMRKVDELLARTLRDARRALSRGKAPAEDAPEEEAPVEYLEGYPVHIPHDDLEPPPIPSAVRRDFDEWKASIDARFEAIKRRIQAHREDLERRHREREQGLGYFGGIEADMEEDPEEPEPMEEDPEEPEMMDEDLGLEEDLEADWEDDDSEEAESCITDVGSDGAESDA